MSLLIVQGDFIPGEFLNKFNWKASSVFNKGDVIPSNGEVCPFSWFSMRIGPRNTSSVQERLEIFKSFFESNAASFEALAVLPGVEVRKLVVSVEVRDHYITGAIFPVEFLRLISGYNISLEVSVINKSQ
jgi:hypothetical protein